MNIEKVKTEVKSEPESPEADPAEEMAVEAETKIEVKDEPLREMDEPADVEILTESLPNTPSESDDDDSNGYGNEMSSDSDDYRVYMPPPGVKIQPYQFEPEYTDEEMKKIDQLDREKEERMKLMPWCTCESCVPTQDTRRQICCKLPHFNKLREEKDPYALELFCITDHEDFKCIFDKKELDFLRHFILIHNKDKDIEEKLMKESKAMYRYLAYRRFTHWINCLTNMGEDRPIPIPSCVTRAVRIKFKEADKVYPRFSIRLPGEEHLIDFPA